MARRLILVAAALLMAPAASTAQALPDGGPDPAKVRVKFGPLWMNPSISLTNLGADDNVFNEPDNQAPKRDFTFTLSPQTDLWLRVSRTWVTARIKEDIVWYQKYSSERSGNETYSLAWKAPFNRLAFSVGGNWLSSRDRPGYEIDARAKRLETRYEGAAEIRALSKTYLGVTAGWQKVDFAQTAEFLGINLHDELNRTSRMGGVTVRHQLTPLTSLTFTASRQEDRFTFQPSHDADSTAFSGTVRFDPAALVRGNATFGYRDFAPRSAALPEYKGSTVAVDVAYAMFDTTKFGLNVNRDVQYSYEVNQPYYLQTGFTASVAQQLFGPLDLTARAGGQRLDYRDVAGATVAASNRIDHVRIYGGGLGYHFGRDTRLGFTIDHQERTSPVDSHRYTGLKYGTSLTYGT